tara:strand:+ start:244 stop:474 length:231 start_codon:yes stop_codon:yes gene_type:complete
MENLYDNDRELWFDIQLETTECDECGNNMNPMESIPVRKDFKGYTISKGFIFICRSCDKWYKEHDLKNPLGVMNND